MRCVLMRCLLLHVITVSMFEEKIIYAMSSGIKLMGKRAGNRRPPPNPYITTAVMTLDLDLPLTLQSAVGCPTGQTWSYNALEPTIMHEISHPLGLKDCYPQCTGSSIMGANDPRVQSPTPCDIQAVKNRYTPPSGSGGGDGGPTYCSYRWGVWGVYNREGDLIGYEWEYIGCF